MTIREIINHITESGKPMDSETNVEEIKLRPGNIQLFEFVGILPEAEPYIEPSDVETAQNEIEDAITNLRSALRSLDK